MGNTDCYPDENLVERIEKRLQMNWAAL